LLAVLVDVFCDVTATVILYNTPEANVPVEISFAATVDFTFLLSSKDPSLSFFVVTSILIPELGIFELRVTLKEYVPDKAVTVVVPGSGSKVKAMFSSTSTGGGGGGGGVGVDPGFLPHDVKIKAETKSVTKLLFNIF
jgi:hypothetical protein